MRRDHALEHLALLAPLVLLGCGSPPRTSPTPAKSPPADAGSHVGADSPSPLAKAKVVPVSTLEIGTRAIETRWADDTSVIVDSALGVLRIATKPGADEEILFRYPQRQSARDLHVGDGWAVVGIPSEPGAKRKGHHLVSLRDRSVRLLGEQGGHVEIAATGTALVWSDGTTSTVMKPIDGIPRRLEGGGDVVAVDPAGAHALFYEIENGEADLRTLPEGRSVFKRKVDGLYGHAFGNLGGEDVLVLADALTVYVVSLRDGAERHVAVACPGKHVDVARGVVGLPSGIYVHVCSSGPSTILDLSKTKSTPNERTPHVSAGAMIDIGPNGDIAVTNDDVTDADVTRRTFFRRNGAALHPARANEVASIAGVAGRRIVKDARGLCAFTNGTPTSVFAEDICGGVLSPSGASFAGAIGGAFQIRDVDTGDRVYSAGDPASATGTLTVTGSATATSLDLRIVRRPHGVRPEASGEVTTVSYPRTVPTTPSTFEPFEPAAPPPSRADGKPTKPSRDREAATPVTKGTISWVLETTRNDVVVARVDPSGPNRTSAPLDPGFGSCRILGLLDHGSILLVRCGKSPALGYYHRLDATTLRPVAPPRSVRAHVLRDPATTIGFTTTPQGLASGAVFDPVSGEPQLVLEVGKDFVVVRDFADHFQLLGNRTAAAQWLRCDDGGAFLRPFASCAKTSEAPLF